VEPGGTFTGQVRHSTREALVKARAIIIRGVVVAAVAAGAVAVVAAPAQALPRNACQDLYTKIEYEADQANYYYDWSVSYTAMGLTAMAHQAQEESDAYAAMAGSDFDLAYSMGC
jgi:hypothetical protein